MGVRKTSTINCETIDDFGEQILALKEEVAHKETYYENSDAELRKIKLEAMIEQQRINNV